MKKKSGKNKSTKNKSVTITPEPAQTVTVVVDEQKSGHRVVSVFTDFTSFLREQKVIGLAIAVVLGAAVTKLVASLVADIINPVIGVLVGAAGDLSSMSLKIGPIKIMWGNFLASVIDFVIIATVVYILVKVLRLDKIDKPAK